VSRAELEVAWRFSFTRSPDLRDPEHGGTLRSLGRWSRDHNDYDCAEVVGLSFCVVQPRGLVVQNDLDNAGIDITALADGRVETHPALCGDNVTAN
jgi:hypothetical protein